MTRGFWLRTVLPIVLGLLVAYWFVKDAEADTAYEALVKVQYFRAERTIGELPTFWLTFDDSTVTLMGDAKLPIVRWLAEQDGKVVRLRLEPRELERIAR